MSARAPPTNDQLFAEQRRVLQEQAAAKQAKHERERLVELDRLQLRRQRAFEAAVAREEPFAVQRLTQPVTVEEPDATKPRRHPLAEHTLATNIYADMTKEQPSAWAEDVKAFEAALPGALANAGSRPGTAPRQGRMRPTSAGSMASRARRKAWESA